MGKVRPDAGFSLIELVIIVAIIASVMAVLTPSIRQSTDLFTLRRAANLAVVELRTAHSLATSNGYEIMFEFYNSTGSPGTAGGIRYWARDPGAAVPTWYEVRHVLPPEWPAIIQFRDPSGLASCVAPADTSHKCVTFKPLGYADVGGEIRIRVRSSGSSWKIEIQAATARVTVTR